MNTSDQCKSPVICKSLQGREWFAMFDVFVHADRIQGSIHEAPAVCFTRWRHVLCSNLLRITSMEWAVKFYNKSNIGNFHSVVWNFTQRWVILFYNFRSILNPDKYMPNKAGILTSFSNSSIILPSLRRLKKESFAHHCTGKMLPTTEHSSS